MKWILELIDELLVDVVHGIKPERKAKYEYDE